MLPLSFGIAIHNIKSWANLKDWFNQSLF
jgi:hypothetical protein